MLNVSNKTKKIKCRGKDVELYPIDGSATLSRAIYVGATIYFSCEQPIAIHFKKKPSIMTFETFGEITTNNKILLRKTELYKTLPPDDFNCVLYDLITRS